MPGKMKKIVIVAGDTSGDLYGGSLAKKLKEISCQCQIYSFGGKVLAKDSTQLIDLVSGSVCGFVEIITSLVRIKRLFDKTLAQIKKIHPDLVILIDFPDFNLGLAKKINRSYPVFYYVSPQVWAWRRNRIQTIKKYADKIIPIFSFESELYQQEGMESFYFGHPLLEIIKKENTKEEKIISLLPGSRKNEIKHHLGVLAKTKEIIERKLPSYRFQVLKPQGTKNELYYKFFNQEEIFTHSYQLLAKSKFIITASGTSTIESAILGIPHIIIYRVNKLTWCIVKSVVKAEFAGMLNILSGKLIVPELLQNKATPQNIAKTTLNYLENKEAYADLKQKLSEARKILEPDNGISQFAEFISGFLTG